MKINFTRPTLYMSHSIQGDNGDIIGNCQKAQKVARKIRRIFPEVKIYCPGEQNLIMDVLHKTGVLTVEQILEADCTILRNCHGWFWWYSSPSEGCEREAREAKLYRIDCPVSVIKTDLTKASFTEIRRLIGPIVKEAIKNFRG